MNRIAYELGYNVLVTGHNLDDEASVLWGNLFHWQIDALVRQSPVLPADRPGLARKVKPLCRFYERDMAAYALLRGIEYVYDECPFSVNASTLRNKLTLNEMEQKQPGTMMQFYIGFLGARERGLFTLPAGRTSAAGALYSLRAADFDARVVRVLQIVGVTRQRVNESASQAQRGVKDEIRRLAGECPSAHQSRTDLEVADVPEGFVFLRSGLGRLRPALEGCSWAQGG